MAPAPQMIPQIVETPNGQQIVMQQVFAQPQFQQAPQFAQVYIFFYDTFLSLSVSDPTILGAYIDSMVAKV
jgi:hypothetical protein